MQNNKIKNIENKFFDLVVFIFSFIISTFKSFFLLLWINKSFKDSYFFRILDFIFIYWPKYFWSKPTIFKIFNFFADFINYVFYKKSIIKENIKK